MKPLMRAAKDEDEISSCHMCARGIFVSRQRASGSRFCSSRCREAYDAGFPRPDPVYARKVTASKFEDWRVVAGGEPGSIYYAPFLAAVAARPKRSKKRRKVSNGPQVQTTKFVQNNPAISVACKDTFADRGSVRDGVSALTTLAGAPC
jgi:hypothetical protein